MSYCITIVCISWRIMMSISVSIYEEFAVLSSTRTSTNNGAETGYSSGAHEFNPGFVCFCSVLLVIICVFCLFLQSPIYCPSIFGLGLPVWYLHRKFFKANMKINFLQTRQIYRPPSKMNVKCCHNVLFDAFSSCSRRVMIGILS